MQAGAAILDQQVAVLKSVQHSGQARAAACPPSGGSIAKINVRLISA